MFLALSSRRSARLEPRLFRNTSHYSRPFSISSWFRPPNVPAQSQRDSSGPEKRPNVVGTAPYHTSYTLLRHPSPPSIYPPRLDAEFSPLGRNLMVQAVRNKGNLNFWWDGERQEHEQAMGHDKQKDNEQYPFITFYASDPLASDGQLRVGVRIGTVTSSQDPESFLGSSESGTIEPWNEEHGVYLLVCTHGARDCRCADRGVPLVDALHKELSARRAQDGEDSMWSRIRVGEVGHVGGHKYAPNLLVFPFGDWLAQLTPEHVPPLLDTISARHQLLRLGRVGSETGDADGVREALDSPMILDESIWRGRMGLTKEDQIHLFEKFAASDNA